jgi:rubrerythrin
LADSGVVGQEEMTNIHNIKEVSYMNFKSVDEILEFAIGKEKEAVAFYNELSKKESLAAMSNTFKELAQEEARHVKLLTSISKNKDVIKSYELKKITDLKISDYLTAMEYTENMPMQDILVLAMKREELAVKLYNDLALSSKDDEFIKLFKVLAQEEAKHKLYFEKLYDDDLAGQGN